MYTAFHNHSYYSVLDGFSSPKEYFERAKEIGLKGFQISEHGNQYSWPYFTKLSKEYPEIKFLYGIEFYESFDINTKDTNQRYFHLLVTCINEQSRIAMNNLITKSNTDGFYYKPRVDLNMLKPYGDLFVVSSACLASKLAREKDYSKCIDYVYEYKSIFKYFYLELMSHKTPDQIEYNQKLLKLSSDTKTDIIITCDSHASTKEDLYYQGKLVQVARDDETVSEIYEDCYLQSENEIHEIMNSQIGTDNVNIALENTNKICDIIEDVKIPFQSPTLPHYPLPQKYDNEYEYLKSLSLLGWETRGFNNLSNEEQKIRKERLDYELDVIHKMNFDGYFLIVWDFVNWAKNNNVKVGPGRGSAGGSIICYLLGITELDPIKYNLIFERFLNNERVSWPDVDLDFDNRDKIVEYLNEKYGSDKVAQIINFSYITPIVAIKDTARILGIPYNISEQISKKFTYPTFQECLDNNKELLEKYSNYHELFIIASKLYDRLRNVSVHAGGVGIVNTNINDYMGIKLGAKNEKVIQVDKKIAEDIGIIKFDILGVSTLSVIKEILNDAKINEWEISPNNNNFINDSEMYNILQKADTNGIFQVESQGMKDLLLRLRPDNIEDVSAVLALYRPDSMDFLEDYIYYKHNLNEIKVWHDDMLPLTKETYGCVVYQEQLMNIVRQFGGRTMGGADQFRKAIGKKDVELVKEESKKLYQEIINTGYTKELALRISDYLASKGGYMFCKAHSMLYSVITLQTAYLKAHYPIYFFKALLNQNINDYGILNKYIMDAQNHNVKISIPNINTSERNFSVKNNEILFGLEAIKGIGNKLVDQILEERDKNGTFKNLKDFNSRVNCSISQNVSLIKAGAIPCKNKRNYMNGYVESLIEYKEYKPVSTLPSNNVLQEKYNIVFNKNEDKIIKLEKYNKLKKEEHYRQFETKKSKHLQDFNEKYLSNEDLWEFETLSIFLTNNPFEDSYKYITPVDECKENSKCVIIGVISNITKKKDKNGKQFAFVNIYSTFGINDITFWHQQYKDYEEQIKRGNQVAILCKKTDDNRLIAEKLKPYAQWILDISSKKPIQN